MKKLFDFKNRTFTIALESFKYYVHTDLVAKLETVGKCFLWTIYIDGNPVDKVFLYARLVTLLIVAIHL
ncbi:MAG: hypothetical protein ACOYL3_27055 [Desulfuromonadaceae bacterium]